MQSPSTSHRNSPAHNSNNVMGENASKTEEMRRRRQRRRRRRPVSNLNSDLLSTTPPSPSRKNNDNNYHQESQSLPFSSTTLMDDPFHVIAMAVDYDENKRDALKILQVPLETGKLYHNEKLFFRALSHLRKESRSFRLGWLIPFLSSQYWKKDLIANFSDDATRSLTNEKHQRPEEEEATTKARHRDLSRSPALTPIILSGLLASLDNLKFATRESTMHKDSMQERATATTTTSTELVNYTVGMRRAAMARVRLRKKRERTHRIVKPILAIVTVLSLYCYAWSNLQRLLVGFYGVTNIVLVPPDGSDSNPTELRVDLLRLITSSCRSRSNANHYGYLSDYSKACRITEASAFELLTSPYNSRHTKLLARIAYDEIAVDGDVPNDSHTKLSAVLMQYDDDYDDDTELPFYAMHTILGDNESSIIPLEDVIRGRRQGREKLKRQRWRRRRRRQQKYKQQRQRNDGFDIVATTYERLSGAVQFWGDTTVNHLVREAIVEAHYEEPSSSPTKSAKASSSIGSNKLKLLDVGSGLSGTLFSLCTSEFPFEDWSYHGIAISQPEVRRANQLVDTVVRPILSSASKLASSSTTDNGDHIISGQDGDTSQSNNFPLSNITIEQASFDEPLTPKEYTVMVAIESLAFSHNITKTLINLAKSLKPKGTLIIIEDVVAPWAVVSGNDESSNSENDYLQRMAKLSGKPSLLTHEEWLASFAAADLTLHRVRDLTLEFDTLSMDTISTSTATAVTGLPFVGFLIGERPWYTTGHRVLKSLINWFGRRNGDGSNKDDDGNLSHRALLLMEDMMEHEQGNVYRRAAHNRADLGYYMYICTNR